jgi:thiol-disulfide isomerase/thioredoxin
LTGRGGWLNTAKPLSLRQVRGKVVILDFWTFCCANCLHVLDELRPLQDKYRDVLVVVGVHSPKFAHEADHAAVTAAVERFEVRHPVLDDPDLGLWRQYAVRAWPTLVVIDPEGYVVAQAAGEGQVSALDRIVAEIIRTHDAKGTLRRDDGPYLPPRSQPTELRFPAKAIRVGAICWSPTRGITRSSNSTSTRRLSAGASAPASAVTATATSRSSPSRTG